MVELRGFGLPIRSEPQRNDAERSFSSILSGPRRHWPDVGGANEKWPRSGLPFGRLSARSCEELCRGTIHPTENRRWGCSDGIFLSAVRALILCADLPG